MASSEVMTRQPSCSVDPLGRAAESQLDAALGGVLLEVRDHLVAGRVGGVPWGTGDSAGARTAVRC